MGWNYLPFPNFNGETTEVWELISNFIQQFTRLVITYSCWYLSWLMFVNSLWPSDAIWQQASMSTLVQVMACCLTAPSHYLNKCWFIFSKVQWHSVEGNLTRDSSPFNHKNKLENYLSKILLKFPRGQWVKESKTMMIGSNHTVNVSPGLSE